MLSPDGLWCVTGIETIEKQEAILLFFVERQMPVSLYSDQACETFMRKALDLARGGAGSVAPNPMVGAVIVRGGVVIGQGWHRKFGGPHAEVNAIADCRAAGIDPAGATMFVTLEPCCHTGKTPPCTEAIIQAGIAEVHIAVADVHEAVAGGGIARLRDVGIAVYVGVCAAEARRLNLGFFLRHQAHRPAVIAKWAQSLDGKLAWPREANRRWITGTAAREHVHRVRSECGAVLTGIGTVLTDDPLLNVRLAGEHPTPLRVVLDSGLRLPRNSQLVKTAKQWPVLAVCCDDVLPGRCDHRVALERAGVEVIGFDRVGGHVDCRALLGYLADRGMLQVLLEGGPRILEAFAAGGWIDATLCYLAGVIVGQHRDLPAVPANLAVGLEAVDMRSLGDDVLISGYTVRLEESTLI